MTPSHPRPSSETRFYGSVFIFDSNESAEPPGTMAPDRPPGQERHLLTEEEEAEMLKELDDNWIQDRNPPEQDQ